ncbi:MAG: hypothetical protein QXS19_06980 [Candidatus Methanomethylicia archaeon]
MRDFANISKLEWGDHGAYAYIIDNPNYYKVGDRVDLPNVTLNVRGKNLTFPTSGAWYVYDFAPFSTIGKFIYRLIRPVRDLCFYGEGEVYEDVDIARIYSMPAFTIRDERMFITFNKNMRRYRVLVKAAYNILKNFIPIWQLSGGFKLKNIYHFDAYDDELPFIKQVLSQRSFPSLKNVVAKPSVASSILSNMSEMYTLSDFFEEPGFVIFSRVKNRLSNSEEEVNRYTIVRAVVINLTKQPHKVTTYLSDYIHKDFYKVEGDTYKHPDTSPIMHFYHE